MTTQFSAHTAGYNNASTCTTAEIYEYPDSGLGESIVDEFETAEEQAQSLIKTPAKRQNRRRVRHRPRRARTSCCGTNSASTPCSSGGYPQLSPYFRPLGWHNISNAPPIPQLHDQSKERQWYSPPRIREDNKARDRRFFGGTTDDDEDEGSPDLRGPMLDVVLGLFDGIDYED